MDKGAIEKFAVTARVKLRQSVGQRMAVLGIGADGALASVQIIGDVVVVNLNNGMETRLTKEESSHRDQLIKEVIRAGYDNVVESVAYTWFNRLIAIRYMEVNDYLPTHIRVLSSAIHGKKEPDLVSQCLSVDLSFSTTEKERILELKNKEELDRLFVLLFLKQCRELNKILPELFTATRPYENILLNLSFTDPDSVVRDLIDGISEDDFKDAVQIIGWMYQYYNKELKDETEKLLDKGIKVTKERLPSKTQLFTPDWVVRYMVENSVGRLWLDGHNDSSLKSKWKYYLDEAEQEQDVKVKLEQIRNERKKIKPESIKVIDPCMGSGHILVYAFDVLMHIYESYGYGKSDAARSIVENNLYGVDIDDRAYQLAYFSVMMKARQYDPEIFSKKIKNNIHSIIGTSDLDHNLLKGYGNKMGPIDRLTAETDLTYILNSFKDAKMYGSLIDVHECDWRLIDQFIADRRIDLFSTPLLNEQLLETVDVAKVLSQRYDVVVTNPPYMGNKAMASNLSDYVKRNYPDSKTDLFACFIEKCIVLLRENGYCSMITMHAFMFLTSYEKLRVKLNSDTVINMAHLGAHAFDEIGGEVVQTTSFIVVKCGIKKYRGTYLRLIGGVNEADKERAFLHKEQMFIANRENYNVIPGKPIVYWMSNTMKLAFENGVPLEKIASPRQGLATADNNRFLRFWYEVDKNSISFDSKSISDSLVSGKKWFPYNKGGEYRKWYGNNDYVVNWKNDGEEIRNFKDEKGKQRSVIRNPGYYFHSCITWSKISSGSMAFRYKPEGHIFDVAGTSVFADKPLLWYLQGFCNSNVALAIGNMISPTLNYEVGHIASFPIIRNSDCEAKVSKMVQQNVRESKNEWDSYEVSWDFLRDPLVSSCSDGRISSSFELLRNKMKTSFDSVKTNEEGINSLLIDLYGLSDEMSPAVTDDRITIRIPTKESAIKNLIQYSVGCMFGRYSLDNNGLIYAGGKFDFFKYEKYKVDVDNIIPINDDEYFGDDIVMKFVDFIAVVFGKECIEENLRYVADNLGVKGSGTSRDRIRQYFLKDFYKDHLRMYQNRPIYWLFDSGKENGFKALIYMHRYEPGLIGKMRQNYLLPMQRRYADQLSREKDQVKRGIIQKKLSEVERYDLAMELYSSNPVSINLDDGVKVNYSKFQNIENSRSSKDKIDLLYKI